MSVVIVNEPTTTVNVNENVTIVEVVEDDRDVAVEGEQTLTVVVEEVPTIVELANDPGPQGSPGPAGAAGEDAGLITIEAGEALSGHRAVRLVNDQALYASAATSSHRQAAMGVTLAAAILGDDVAVQTHGVVDESSWAWTPGAIVFLGTAGALTQTPPAAPSFLRVLGHAISATRLFVDPQPTITLA